MAGPPNLTMTLNDHPLPRFPNPVVTRKAREQSPELVGVPMEAEGLQGSPPPADLIASETLSRQNAIVSAATHNNDHNGQLRRLKHTEVTQTWAKKASISLHGPSFVDRLPDELLVHVLANLDHMELRSAMLVCARWNRVISDDSCWRYAFELNFGCLPVRRLGESSWRKEYLKRVQLLQGFRGGNHIVQFDPRIGNIDGFFLNFDDGWMYCGSTDKGMVAFCHPSTGRVEKGFVFFNDDRNPQKVASVLLDRRRIAVGSMSGGLSLVTDFKDRSNYVIQRFTGFHTGGPLTCLAWVQGYPHAIVSGGTDGTVKVWDIRNLLCVRTLSGPSNAAITTLTCGRKQAILAGNERGDVLVWEVDVSEILEESVSLPSLNGTSIAATRVLYFPDRANVGNVTSIFFDSASFSAVVVVHSASRTSTHQWDVRRGCITTIFSGGHSATVSAASLDQPTAKSLASGNDRLLLATGDEEGVVCVWDVPRPTQQSDANADVKPTSVRPVRVVHAHRSAITQLQIDPFKVVSGAMDGSVKVIDILTSRCIRTLIVRRTRGGNDGLLTLGGGGVAEKRKVRCIWAGHHQVVVATGDHVKSWDFGSYSGAATSGKGKKKGAGQWANGVHRPFNPKTQRQILHNQQRMQIRDDVREDRWERDHDREIAEQRTRRAVKLNGPGLLNSHGHKLSEDELVDYAIMMSMEQLTANEPMDKDLLEALEKSLLDEQPRTSADTPFGSGTDAGSSSTPYPPRVQVIDANDDQDELAKHQSDRILVYGSSAGSSSSSLTDSRLAQWETVRDQYAVRSGRNSRSSQGNVTVLPRLSQASIYSAAAGRAGAAEDEELQYVLELSRVEK